MSDFAINPAGPGSINHVRSTAPIHQPLGYESSGAASLPGRLAAERSDRVELSDHARLLDRMRQMPDVRQERIERVRAAIARGGYDNDARVNQAIDRLLAEEDLIN